MKTNDILANLKICAGLAILAVSLLCEDGKAAESSNATDYSVAAHWMSLPATNKTVDVFYLYPPIIIKSTYQIFWAEQVSDLWLRILTGTARPIRPYTEKITAYGSSSFRTRGMLILS